MLACIHPLWKQHIVEHAFSIPSLLLLGPVGVVETTVDGPQKAPNSTVSIWVPQRHSEKKRANPR